MRAKKNPSTSFFVSGIACLAVILAVTFFLKEFRSPTGTPLVPTKPIDTKNAVGGRLESGLSASEGTFKNNSDETPDNHSPQPDETKPVAPRQQEITKSVTTNYPYRALGVTPNDPYYANSWLLQRTNASSAWGITTGAPVVVAIIDTGYALDHEDLASQWHTNTNETGMTSVGDTCWTGTSQSKTSNNCDDDENGYLDDWRGWNFINTSNNPQAGTTSEYGTGAISHGTSVAGLAGAATNNGKGIATYNWNTRLMPLVALDDSGSGTTSGVVSAIYYAVENGASIINLSLGGPANDPALQLAIDFAYANDVVIIAAAGNCGTTGDAGCDGLSAPTMMYPAQSNHVIAVGATNSSDARASFSSYGPGLDVVAPGSGSIISPLIDSRTAPYNYTTAYAGSLHGTSFASPVVTGVASLIRSLRPTSSVDDILALINAAATKVPSMNGQVYTNELGHGLVNAATAATIAASLNQTSQTTPKLAQTGDHRSEHSYSTAATMSSGCSVSAGSYCTIRLTNPQGYDRFLPYAKTADTGQIGWQWSGSILQSGEWFAAAQQGDMFSDSAYFLFSK